MGISRNKTIVLSSYDRNFPRKKSKITTDTELWYYVGQGICDEISYNVNQSSLEMAAFWDPVIERLRSGKNIIMPAHHWDSARTWKACRKEYWSVRSCKLEIMEVPELSSSKVCWKLPGRTQALKVRVHLDKTGQMELQPAHLTYVPYFLFLFMEYNFFFNYRKI